MYIIDYILIDIILIKDCVLVVKSYQVFTPVVRDTQCVVVNRLENVIPVMAFGKYKTFLISIKFTQTVLSKQTKNIHILLLN